MSASIGSRCLEGGWNVTSEASTKHFDLKSDSAFTPSLQPEVGRKVAALLLSVQERVVVEGWSEKKRPVGGSRGAFGGPLSDPGPL